MCSVVVWQVRPRGVEEEVCSEEKAYLSQSSIPAGLGGTCLRKGVHAQPAFVFLGNPAGLEVRDESFRLWGWLAWKVAITEVPLLGVLGHSAAHLCATVSRPHSGADWGLSQAPRLRLLTTRAAFSCHAQQKLPGSEAAFHCCAPEVVHSENYPGMLTGRCREWHCPGRDSSETRDF